MTHLPPIALAQSEYLLQPAQVLRPEGPVRDWAVVVKGGRFAHVGPAAEVCAAHPHLTPQLLPDMLLMPGMVDAHAHFSGLAQTLRSVFTIARVRATRPCVSIAAITSASANS